MTKLKVSLKGSEEVGIAMVKFNIIFMLPNHFNLLEIMTLFQGEGVKVKDLVVIYILS